MKSKIDPNADVARILEVDQHRGYAKWLKRWVVVAFLVIVAAAGVVIWRTSGTSDSTQFKTEEVKRGDLTVIVTATGTLQPTNKVDVGSELSGIIKSVEVDYNSKVKVGQVLARLDTSKLEATGNPIQGRPGIGKGKGLAGPGNRQRKPGLSSHSSKGTEN